MSHSRINNGPKRGGYFKFQTKVCRDTNQGSRILWFVDISQKVIDKFLGLFFSQKVSLARYDFYWWGKLIDAQIDYTRR